MGPDERLGSAVNGMPPLGNLPEWVAWIAQDADGAWWAYEAEPNKQDRGWYENEVGRIIRLGHTTPHGLQPIVDRSPLVGQAAPPEDWETTLRRV